MAMLNAEILAVKEFEWRELVELEITEPIEEDEFT